MDLDDRKYFVDQFGSNLVFGHGLIGSTDNNKLFVVRKLVGVITDALFLQ